MFDAVMYKPVATFLSLNVDDMYWLVSLKARKKTLLKKVNLKILKSLEKIGTLKRRSDSSSKINHHNLKFKIYIAKFQNLLPVVHMHLDSRTIATWISSGDLLQINMHVVKVMEASSTSMEVL